MKNDFESLLKGNWRLKEHTIFDSNDEIIGVLNPSILISNSLNSETYVLGVNGVTKSIDSEANGIWAAIAGVGGILFGNAKEVAEVSKLFHDDHSSRTMAYLSGLTNSCEELLRFNSKIRNANILILGTGGIGSMTAILLAGAGVRRMTIVDGDVIERSNLNRQLFYTKNDVGKNKVEILEREIQKRFDNVHITSVATKVTLEDVSLMVPNFDLTFSTLDEPASISRSIAKLRESNRYNIIQAGYLFLTSKLYFNYEFKNSSNENIQFRRGNSTIVPSFGPTNSELAGLASAAIIQILCGKINDGMYMEFQSNIFPRNIISYE